MKKILSVVAPMYNEENLVGEFIKVFNKSLDPIRDRFDIELVLVNDGSKDQTLQGMEAEQKRNLHEITVVNLTRNFGLEGAVSAGLRVASGDAVVVMDADLQDPPSVILSMVELWEQGNDIVIAKRSKRKHDSLIKRLTASTYYYLQEKLSGRLKLERNAANFRLLSRYAVDMLNSLPEVNTVFRVTVPFLGMKTAIVEYERDQRFAGKTKYNFRSSLRYALDGLTGASIEPLRILGGFACFALVLAVIAFCCIFAVPQTWKACCVILLIVSLLFAVLLTGLAIMAEYIGQIMLEVKGRPTSLIYEVKHREGE